ncbi:hypothetical protein C0Q70_01408 [Pomacea canaliculata]|uniref:Cytochrome P450 n=1 Tax=Pomacea canaliculata TaxID=400727 RepID=A0A2T7PZD3_POMCA|nr:hypothetical protein C0Q70_01408 [Pomacea canaliculata]
MSRIVFPVFQRFVQSQSPLVSQGRRQQPCLLSVDFLNGITGCECKVRLRHLKRHFSIFERLNIPGPKPSILVGNLREIMKKGQFHATVEWSQKYGRVFGFFEGYTPVLSISDPDILSQILGKDASNFMSRKPFPLAPRKSLGLFLENGHQWRRSRSLLTPAFSSGKLKQMMNIMTTSADMLVENLSSRCRGREGTVDMYSAFQSLSLDVIGRCAFGLQTRAQTDPNDEFLITINSCQKVLDNTGMSIHEGSVSFSTTVAVPFLSTFIFALKNMVVFFGMNPVVWLRLRLREVIRIRKEMGPNNRITDLVQLMLFPPTHRSHVEGTGDEDASHEDKLHAKMTEREVVAQSLTFLLAGYETTSAVLALLSHLLAHNPHVQARLLQEIDSLPNKEVTYQTVQKMEYFDMVFDEACRLFPTASLIVTRKADKAREFKGFTIPAGMNIHANIWALHHDPEFWNHPEDFDPERLSRFLSSLTAK